MKKRTHKRFNWTK